MNRPVAQNMYIFSERLRPFARGADNGITMCPWRLRPPSRKSEGLNLWEEYGHDLARTYGRRAGWGRALTAPFLHPGVRAVLCYRLAHRCSRRGLTRLLAALLKRIGRLTTGAEIDPRARIGAGLHLPHPTGVVIGASVDIRGHATIFQDVTLGPRQNPIEGPTLGLHTFVYAGARILGEVRVGSRTQIGPNCVVFRDLPAGSTVLPPEPIVLEGMSFQLRFRADDEKESEPESVRADARTENAEEISAHG